MADRVKLEVRPRERLGSRESRRMRREGIIPGVLYGGGKDPVAICVPERALRRALGGAGGLNAILDVVVAEDGDGRPRPAVLKDYQQDPVRGYVTHVDLQEVRLDRAIHATVPIVLVGESPGDKEGGVLQQVTREINVEALPMNLPEHIDLDVGELQIGETLRVADLQPMEGITYLDDPDVVLASVTQPTRVEEPEEMLEEGEEVTGVPEGEEAPEGGAESALEPGGDAAGNPGTAAG